MTAGANLFTLVSPSFSYTHTRCLGPASPTFLSLLLFLFLFPLHTLLLFTSISFSLTHTHTHTHSRQTEKQQQRQKEGRRGPVGQEQGAKTEMKRGDEGTREGGKEGGEGGEGGGLSPHARVMALGARRMNQLTLR